MATPVQTLCKAKSQSGISATSITATVGATANSAGNSLLALCANKGSTSGATVTGVSDSSATNVYNRCGSTFAAANAGEIFDVFLCQDPVALAATTGTVTAAYSGTMGAAELIVVELPGQWAFDAATFATQDSGSSGTTSPTVVTITPTNNGSFIFAVIAYGSNTAPTIASGDFTFWDSQAQSGGSASLLGVAYVSQATAAADGAVWSTPSTKAGQVVGAFYPAVSAAPFKPVIVTPRAAVVRASRW